MSIRSKILVGAATVTLVGAAALAGAGSANAETPACGATCVEFSAASNSQLILDDPGSITATGTPITTFPPSVTNPAEDFIVQSPELVIDYYQAGLVTAAVALHYGCDPGVDFVTCGANQADDLGFELQFAPGGAPTGQCVGVAATAVAGEHVTLQPCGVSGKTLWIVNSTTSVTAATGPLVNGSDTNFSNPYVLTTTSTSSGGALETENLENLSDVPNDQLWSAHTGPLAGPAISPLTVTTTSLPAATSGQAYSATLAATGGIAPYSWSVTSGSLPPGLTLNSATGQISGTSDGSGTYSFTVTVTDAEVPMMTATQALSISVTGPVITSLRPSSGPVYGNTPVTIMVTDPSCPVGTAGCHVSVTFGSTPAFVVFTRPGEIGVISPDSGAAGTVTVTVTVNGVSSQATPADQFTYTGFPF
jgi:putative Ig domain-containing protein/IPT/TIG domain-containing protein